MSSTRTDCQHSGIQKRSLLAMVKLQQLIHVMVCVCVCVCESVCTRERACARDCATIACEAYQKCKQRAEVGKDISGSSPEYFVSKFCVQPVPPLAARGEPV